MSEILEQISTVVIEGDLDEIVDLTEDALDDGLTAKEILDSRLMAGMTPELVVTHSRSIVQPWRRSAQSMIAW